jgi:hypothetical protein
VTRRLSHEGDRKPSILPFRLSKMNFGLIAMVLLATLAIIDRMAARRFNEPMRPMTLGKIRASGGCVRGAAEVGRVSKRRFRGCIG